MVLVEEGKPEGLFASLTFKFKDEEHKLNTGDLVVIYPQSNPQERSFAIVQKLSKTDCIVNMAWQWEENERKRREDIMISLFIKDTEWEIIKIMPMNNYDREFQALKDMESLILHQAILNPEKYDEENMNTWSFFNITKSLQS